MNNKTAQDVIAERALLSTILGASDATLFPMVAGIVSPNDFYEPKNQVLFQTMYNLFNEGKKIDAVSLVTELTNQKKINQAGGVSYIHEILDPKQTLTIGSQESLDPIGYANSIKEKSELREFHILGERILADTEQSSGHRAVEVQSMIEQELSRLLQKSIDDEAVNTREYFPELIEQIKEAQNKENIVYGVMSGFPQLDEQTLGFQGGQLIIIAARPGIGKSTLAVDIGRNNSYTQGKTTLMFSLEMGTKEVMTRIVSAEANVPTHLIKKGDLSDIDWVKIHEAEAHMQDGTFIIDPGTATTIADIQAKVNQQLLKPEGLDLVIIDYVQLMNPTKDQKFLPRQQQLTEISRALKLLAKKANVPVIILAQLNRNPEQRSDGMPVLSDLRESGALEQDADIVLMIHRPQNVEVSEEDGGTATLLIRKHRGGSSESVPLVPMMSYSKFAPGEGKIPIQEGDIPMGSEQTESLSAMGNFEEGMTIDELDDQANGDPALKKSTQTALFAEPQTEDDTDIWAVSNDQKNNEYESTRVFSPDESPFEDDDPF